MKQRSTSERKIKKVVITYFPTKFYPVENKEVYTNVEKAVYFKDRLIKVTLTNGVKNIIPIGSNVKIIEIFYK